MNHKEIRNLLLMMFEIEFDINTKVGITDSKTDAFIHSISFEYRNQGQDDWHDVTLNVCGTIQKNINPIEYHNPFPEFGGPGEAQGGEIWIDSWEFNEVETYIDGGLNQLISFQDLYDLTEPKTV